VTTAAQGPCPLRGDSPLAIRFSRAPHGAKPCRKQKWTKLLARIWRAIGRKSATENAVPPIQSWGGCGKLGLEPNPPRPGSHWHRRPLTGCAASASASARHHLPGSKCVGECLHRRCMVPNSAWPAIRDGMPLCWRAQPWRLTPGQTLTANHCRVSPWRARNRNPAPSLSPWPLMRTTQPSPPDRGRGCGGGLLLPGPNIVQRLRQAPRTCARESSNWT